MGSPKSLCLPLPCVFPFLKLFCSLLVMFRADNPSVAWGACYFWNSLWPSKWKRQNTRHPEFPKFPLGVYSPNTKQADHVRFSYLILDLTAWLANRPMAFRLSRRPCASPLVGPESSTFRPWGWGQAPKWTVGLFFHLVLWFCLMCQAIWDPRPLDSVFRKVGAFSWNQKEPRRRWFHPPQTRVARLKTLGSEWPCSKALVVELQWGLCRSAESQRPSETFANLRVFDSNYLETKSERGNCRKTERKLTKLPPYCGGCHETFSCQQQWQVLFLFFHENASERTSAINEMTHYSL